MTDTRRGQPSPEGGHGISVIRSILDALEALVYVADLATYEILFVNQTGRDLFGDVVGRRCWEALQGGQSGPCPFCTNAKLLDPDGRPTGGTTWEFQNSRNGRWYHIHDRAIPWDDGRPVRLEIAVDVTEQREAALLLQKSNNLLNETQRLAKIGSWELDLTTDALTWTDEIYRMFDVDPARFKPTYEGFLAAIHPDDREKVDRAYTDSLATRVPYSITHRLLHPDGSVSHVREECTTFFDQETGRPVRSIGTVQDVSKEIAAGEKLREALAVAQQARIQKERFLSVIAYDVKEPVSTLATYLDLLADSGLLPAGPAADYLPVARRTARESVALLDKVIHASALASGDTPLSLQFFDAGVAAFSVVTALTHRADARGVALVNRVPRQVRLYGDPVRYEEVLTNLVENGIRFTPAGGTVTLTLPDGAPGALSVADTGIGIPPEMMDDLFRYGARVARPGVDGQRGLGVGLASNREVMARMEGTLTVRSAVNSGATFTLTLPPRAPRVLLLRFGEREGVRLGRALREGGLKGCEADVGKERIDLLFAPVVPGPDGALAVREARLNHRYDQVPLVALGPEDPELARQAVAAGADRYHSGPLTPAALAHLADRLLLARAPR